jgi:hypothetical protein
MREIDDGIIVLVNLMENIVPEKFDNIPVTRL